MTHSDNLERIAPALIECQSQVLKAKRNKKRDDYTYPDLESVWKACRKQLAANDLVVLQHPTADGGLETVLLHRSGEWMSFTSKTALSTIGTIDDWAKAIGTQRRIGLMSALGIIAETEKAPRSTDLTATEIIARNRRATLSEAVDELIDNGRKSHGKLTRTAADNGLGV
jgi:hypothetical protein